MSQHNLIIFDYSGTLSIDAVLFSRPENLKKHLEESGLKDFGIDQPALFWDQLVNPTWIEGSTTPAGYKKVLEERLRAILYQNMSILSCVQISDAVSSFVNSYFYHSRIDRRWEDILHELSVHPSITVIIATDHYAEATGYIIQFLHELKIWAVPATKAFTMPQKGPFIIANSADMGIHKAEPRFWKILKTGLNMENIRHILMVDDFGYNEQEGDRYGDRHKVDARKEKTVRILESLFQADVQVVTLMIDGDDQEKDDLFGRRITEAALTIERFLIS
jgi:hypothetical protein